MLESSKSVYIDENSLKRAIQNLYSTADHLIKIWFTLKQMGLSTAGGTVEIDTSSSTPSLKQLFSYGSPSGEFFIPFAHTQRFLTMKSDAARSIIQTTIRRWKDSGSVVTVDPTSFLDIEELSDGKLKVSCNRSYPIGLGFEKNGFALDEGKRVSIPIDSFAVWYGRQTPIPEGEEPKSFLLNRLITNLFLSQAEIECVFVPDSLQITTKSIILTDSQINKICSDFILNPTEPVSVIFTENYDQHSSKIKSMITVDDKPNWLKIDPLGSFKHLVESGAKTILLFGPPRTGKTRAIDKIYSRENNRETIQIHDAWSYEHLIEGLQPNAEGIFKWTDGLLKKAIQEGKKVIVLEEINRTQITQSLGEVFSLLEDSYRGEKYKIRLRSGNYFYIPEDVVVIMTMNTIDKSTEEVDDALLGRFYAVEFLPRIEDLTDLLAEIGLEQGLSQKIRELFSTIQNFYPLGHGYFAQFSKTTNPISYYLSRIRLVLKNHLENYSPMDLAQIDNAVDNLFGK